MQLRSPGPAIHTTVFLLLCGLVASNSAFAGQVPLGRPPSGAVTTSPSPARIDSAERAAYTAFYNEENVDAKIHLGEQFDQQYPHSVYEDSVDSALTSLYYNKEDWAKFYAMGEKAIANNPKNLPILELVGWAIPRNSNADRLRRANWMKRFITKSRRWR